MHCNNVYEQTKNTRDFSCGYSWFLLWNKYVETILKRTFVWYTEDRIEGRKTMSGKIVVEPQQMTEKNNMCKQAN